MKKVVFMLILLLVAPIYVYADSVSITCPQGSSLDKEITCTVKGTTSNKITSLSMQVSTSYNLELVSFVPVKEWLGDGANGDIELYSDISKENDFEIGYLKFKISDDDSVSIYLKKIFFYLEDDSEKELDDVSINIDKTKLESNKDYDVVIPDVYLSDIVIDKYDIPFDLNEDSYTLEIGDESSLNITPFIDDGTVSYEIDGNEKLHDGSVINITLKKDNGETKTYTINIKKKSDNNNKLYMYLGLGFICVILIVITISLLKRKNS